MNKQKTEVMRLTKKREQILVNVTLERRRLDQMRLIRYLRSLMTDEESCDGEIRSRSSMGKAAFGYMRTILRNLGVDMQKKDAMLKAYIW